MFRSFNTLEIALKVREFLAAIICEMANAFWNALAFTNLLLYGYTIMYFSTPPFLSHFAIYLSNEYARFSLLAGVIHQSLPMLVAVSMYGGQLIIGWKWGY